MTVAAFVVLFVLYVFADRGCWKDRADVKEVEYLRLGCGS